MQCSRIGGYLLGIWVKLLWGYNKIVHLLGSKTRGGCGAGELDVFAEQRWEEARWGQVALERRRVEIVKDAMSSSTRASRQPCITHLPCKRVHFKGAVSSLFGTVSS